MAHTHWVRSAFLLYHDQNFLAFLDCDPCESGEQYSTSSPYNYTFVALETMISAPYCRLVPRVTNVRSHHQVTWFCRVGNSQEHCGKLPAALIPDLRWHSL